MRRRVRRLAFTTLAVVAFGSACGGGPVLPTAFAPGPGLPTAPPIVPPSGLPTPPAIPGPPTVPALPTLPGLPTPPDIPTLPPLPTPPTDPGPGPIGVLTPWPAPAPTPEPSGYDPLVGRWHYTDEFTQRQITFLPDGRYGAKFTVGDSTISETGVYSADGSNVQLSPQGDEAVVYEMAVFGETFTLSGGNLPAPVEYSLEPGSPDAVIAEQAEFDQREAALDEQWRARLPIAPMTQQPVHIPVGEVPDDPNIGNIFVSPTVFVDPNLYLDITLSEITYTDGSTAQVQNSTKWFFQHTGRVFTVFTNWPQGRFYDIGNPQPDVATYWSAYTIQEGTDTERVLIQTDAGEQIDTFLAHGRRNLIWGTDLYGQVDWENEQMNQGDGGG